MAKITKTDKVVELLTKLLNQQAITNRLLLDFWVQKQGAFTQDIQAEMALRVKEIVENTPDEETTNDI